MHVRNYGCVDASVPYALLTLYWVLLDVENLLLVLVTNYSDLTTEVKFIDLLHRRFKPRDAFRVATAVSSAENSFLK